MVADEDHRNEQILSEVKDVCLVLDIQGYAPRKVLWSKMVPRWGAVDLGEPVLQNHEVYIHRDLEHLTNEEVKPLIAFSLARWRKTGKYAKVVRLVIVSSLLFVLVASFILLPLVLPERVPLSCRGCTMGGNGPLGAALTIYVEPIFLIFAGVFLFRAYSRQRTYKADRVVTAILGANALLDSLKAILNSVPEPPVRSRRITDRQTRRYLKAIRNRISAIESAST